MNEFPDYGSIITVTPKTCNNVPADVLTRDILRKNVGPTQKHEVIRAGEFTFDLGALIAEHPDVDVRAAKLAAELIMLFWWKRHWKEETDPCGFTDGCNQEMACDDATNYVEWAAWEMMPLYRKRVEERKEWDRGKEERERRTYRKKSIPRDLRKQVLERDGFACVECGERFELECDHIVPESKGGPTTLENLRCLCKPCNGKKSSKMLTASPD